jgi:transcription elongation factor Elf1
MSGKTDKKAVETIKDKEIVFKCKYCGETKPLSDLVVMRQYYPQLSACKNCAMGPKIPEQPEQSE